MTHVMFLRHVNAASAWMIAFVFYLAASGKTLDWRAFAGLLTLRADRASDLKQSESRPPMDDRNVDVSVRGVAGRPGFTLIELLVVVGVVVLLLGILLPVLSRVRASAQDTRCLSHLRELGSAAAGRALEHGGYLGLGGMIALPDGTGGPDSLPRALLDPKRQRYSYIPDDYPMWFTSCAPPTRESVVPMLISLVARVAGGDDDVLPRADWHDGFPDVADGRMLLCPRAPQDVISATFTVRGSLAASLVLDGFVIPGPYSFGTGNYAVNGGLLGFHHDPAMSARAYRGLVTRGKGASTLLVAGDNGDDRRGHVWQPAYDASLGDRVTLADVQDQTPQIFDRPSAGVGTRHDGRANLLMLDDHARPVKAVRDVLESIRLVGG